MLDDNWRLLLHRKDLDEFYEMLLKEKRMTEKQRAMALVLFGQANVYVPLVKQIEELERKLAANSTEA